MEILAAVIIYIADIVTGVYAASQMEKDINKRIKK